MLKECMSSVGWRSVPSFHTRSLEAKPFAFGPDTMRSLTDLSPENPIPLIFGIYLKSE